MRGYRDVHSCGYISIWGIHFLHSSHLFGVFIQVMELWNSASLSPARDRTMDAIFVIYMYSWLRAMECLCWKMKFRSVTPHLFWEIFLLLGSMFVLVSGFAVAKWPGDESWLKIDHVKQYEHQNRNKETDASGTVWFEELWSFESWNKI